MWKVTVIRANIVTEQLGGLIDELCGTKCRTNAMNSLLAAWALVLLAFIL